MKEIRVLLKQDDDGHWYMIPKNMEDEFDLALSKIEGQDYMDCPDDFDDFMVVFDNFRTGGSPDLKPEYYKENQLKPIV